MDVVVAHADAHRVGTDGHAFDHDVRVVAQDVAILERARLAFVGIAHEIFRAGEVARHEAPLEPGRKAGAAAPAQRGFLDLGDHRLGRDLFGENLLQRLIAAARLVIFQTPVEAVEILQDQGVRTIDAVVRNGGWDDLHLG